MRLLLVIVTLLCAGCTSTIVPEAVASKTASFDGNEQNSGFLGFDTQGNGRITAHARDRYNALAALYAPEFTPPLLPDAGITKTPTNTFLLDARHLEYFATMLRWHRQAKPVWTK